jgi:hypothetical protein
MNDHSKNKTRNATQWVLPLILSLALLSCQPGIKERELSGLKTKNAELVRQSMLLQSEIHLQQTSIDSLNSTINQLEQQLAKSSPGGEEISADEIALRKLVMDMHDSWKELVKAKDPQVILDYFLPRFMANQIDIDSQNKGHVAAFTELDYKNFLDEITSRKRFSVEFGNVKFLDVTIKDGEFFNVAYKCRMREYKKDLLTETSTVMVTLTGRKITDQWKIANYSVVSFEYAERQ